MLGSFNNCNIIQFDNKTTTTEVFDVANKVVLYGISDNMPALVQNVKYGAINISYPATIDYYVVKLLLEPYMLQD